MKDAEFNNVRAQTAPSTPTFVLKNVEAFETHQCDGFPDTQRDKVEQEKL